jgi:hypothetical protein
MSAASWQTSPAPSTARRQFGSSLRSRQRLSTPVIRQYHFAIGFLIDGSDLVKTAFLKMMAESATDESARSSDNDLDIFSSLNAHFFSAMIIWIKSLPFDDFIIYERLELAKIPDIDDFPHMKTNPKISFYLINKANVAERIPARDIVGGRFVPELNAFRIKLSYDDGSQCIRDHGDSFNPSYFRTENKRRLCCPDR